MPSWTWVGWNFHGQPRHDRVKLVSGATDILEDPRRSNLRWCIADASQGVGLSETAYVEFMNGTELSWESDQDELREKISLG